MEYTESEYDLSIVADGDGDGGIENGRILAKIAEYSIVSKEHLFDDIRTEAVAELGPEKFVDAVAVASAFNSLDRIANATGIPIEHSKVGMTENVRAQLGLDEMATARLPEVSDEHGADGPPPDWGPATHEGL